MSEFETIEVKVPELDLDSCVNKYGALPCTAGVAVHAGTSQAGATANTIKLAAGASGTDGAYNGMAITLADGRRAIITGYVGATKVATVDRGWLINLRKYSEELDNTGGWANSWSGGVAITADDSEAPNGQVTAELMQTIDSTQDANQSNTNNLAVNTVYRAGFKIKNKDASVSRIRIFDQVGADDEALVDLSWAAGIPSLGSTSGASNIKLERVERDWYLLDFDFTTDPVNTDHRVVLFPATTGALGSGAWFSGVHLRKATDPDEYIKAVASAVELPDAVAYRILDVGGECYNTFPTCQDPANYVKGAKTWKFCNAGAPVPAGEQIRPYLESIKTAATEIDLEKGLAIRGKITVALVDEPSSDIEADPYYATRASAALGSFFTRLLARNRNYAGRFARLKTAYFTGAWDNADFTTELYIIDRIEGPDSKSRVKITLSDPVKLTDLVKVPAPSAGALSAAITAGSTSLPLGTDEGAGYDSSGHIRIGDEVMAYSGISTDTLTGLTRAQFGTAAAEASAGDGVQACKVYEAQQPWQVLEDLLLSAGIAAGNIDSAEFESEDDAWLGSGWDITTCLSEPEKVSKYLSELLPQVGGFMWWNPTTQKFQFRVLAPLNPEQAVTATLTDNASIVEDSVKITVLEDLRITQQQIWYDRISAVADAGEAKNFLRLRHHVDVDAESANDYGDVRPQVVYSRWFTEANDAAVGTTASRRVGYYRDAPKGVEIAVDAKDADVRKGDYIDVQTVNLTDTAGAAELARCIVLKHRDEGGRIRLTLRVLNFGFRYAFIAPDGTGDYPTDSEWVHINPDSEVFDDGLPGYQAF